ncbi:MAG TPA: acyl-CoA dehydrogenase family protein [Candidatus Thermoplasmatota archaeon]|nr:acyl-CoA dehydrogenase family protein [Candidatus Thermoplasmatota archaeon]
MHPDARRAIGDNWYDDDPALRDFLRLHVDDKTMERHASALARLGRVAPAEVDPLARRADRMRPVLEGERPGDIRFDPAYRALQRIAREHRVFTLAWEGAPRALAFALGYLYAQAESGYYCPACMTDGAAVVLDRHAPPRLKDALVPRLVSSDAATAYEGAMYLTEKKGGSDVGGATETRAERADAAANSAGEASATATPAATPAASRSPEPDWRLTGLKWFASNCVADVALALARMPDGAPGTRGLGLFVVPRELSDGTPNPGLRVERLKDKLGVASMPTGEVRLEKAHAWLVKGGGEGFRAMMDMVALSRLYNAVASVAVARRGLREALAHGLVREAFGRPLAAHPLYLRGLVGVTADVEAGLALTLATAAAYDRDDALLLRALTPLAKAETARLAVTVASWACEALGGEGYVEDASVTPRLLRDAQVLPIWEGTTNVQTLDFLRAAATGAGDAFLRDVEARLAGASRAAEDARRDARDPRGGLRPAVALLRDALADLETDVGALADVDEPHREASGAWIVPAAYRLACGALLAEAAARSEPSSALRRVAVADLYARWRVSAATKEGGVSGGAVGERALDRATLVAGRLIAYPTVQDKEAES